MTPCHAVDIILTRPATHSELRQASHRVQLAADADRTRLTAVQPARSAGRALHLLRRRLGTHLPIDVLTTHYPDRHGQVLLNVALGRVAHQSLRRSAQALGQRPQDVLRQRLLAALAREEQQRARHLDDRLEDLLADHTPNEVLTRLARRVLAVSTPGHPPHRSPSPPPLGIQPTRRSPAFSSPF
ncbi:hypothetical protein ACF09H_41180 [Streptomyces sp. NPDC014983]|uniref:hypothetical protein n=1 Tax=Streptomyces sp. NPDC014983 TaxID=3364933 RepID=UPI0036FC24C8